MGPKAGRAPPEGETDVQRFMREMHEQRDEWQRNVLQERDDAATAALLLREQAAATLLAGVQAAHAGELAALQARLDALVGAGAGDRWLWA